MFCGGGGAVNINDSYVTAASQQLIVAAAAAAYPEACLCHGSSANATSNYNYCSRQNTSKVLIQPSFLFRDSSLMLYNDA